MFAKLTTGAQILNQEGPKALLSTICQKYFTPSSSDPVRRHIQLLQDKENLVIAEIGVWRGENAVSLLENLDIDEFF